MPNWIPLSFGIDCLQTHHLLKLWPVPQPGTLLMFSTKIISFNSHNNPISHFSETGSEGVSNLPKVTQRELESRTLWLEVHVLLPTCQYCPGQDKTAPSREKGQDLLRNPWEAGIFFHSLRHGTRYCCRDSFPGGLRIESMANPGNLQPKLFAKEHTPVPSTDLGVLTSCGLEEGQKLEV